MFTRTLPKRADGISIAGAKSDIRKEFGLDRPQRTGPRGDRSQEIGNMSEAQIDALNFDDLSPDEQLAAVLRTRQFTGP